jgi:hypothetical protein
MNTTTNKEMQANSVEPNRPIQSIRCGHVEAAVWSRETGKGTMFKVSLQKNYKPNGGEWATTSYLGYSDLLEAAKAIDQAHTYIGDLIRKDRECA